MGEPQTMNSGRPRRMLVLSPFPEEGAGYRFRIGQYIPQLEQAGYEVTVSSFFSPSFFRLVYKKGRYGRKALAFLALALRRLRSVASLRRYDLVYIYREAFPIGPAFIETAISGDGHPPIVYDFDDAVFLPNVSEANRFVASLKYPRKIPSILRRSRGVIAGNSYLADYARQFNRSVVMLPTAVDTERFRPRTTPRDADAPLVVGWIGTPTTAPYLTQMAEVFRQVARTHPFTLRVSGAADDVQIPGVAVENLPWSLEREVELFNTCDVGVYPLTDDEWSRGKCGFKAIQFMATGVPVVAAAVGVNREIVEHGVNGFLASTPDEWITALTRLLDDAALRARFAAAGRATIEARYSTHVNLPRLLATFDDVVAAATVQKGAARS
jgi:glycosyltransferase involved in cell wall biosynthesis